MDCKELSEILECSVCLERLDHTSKVLPCQHTFCKRCLEEIQSMRKELRCPECRILVEDEIDNLPSNIILVRILEGLNRRNPNSSERTSITKQKIPKDPCAKVLFDYEPKEQGDLALSKGDIVILVRQVDENWYEGQIKGSQGFLPANYVDVINPLPCLDDSYDDPVAKALYDFDEVQEEDVLSFKQGDIISVTRRIDENWCEGRIESKCGIFPVNFVVFNSVAKAVIESLEFSNSSGEEASPLPPRPVPKSKASSHDRDPKRHTIHSLEEHEESKLSRVPSRHSVEISSSERLEEAYGDSSTSRGGREAVRPRRANSRPENLPIGGGDLRVANSRPENLPVGGGDIRAANSRPENPPIGEGDLRVANSRPENPPIGGGDLMNFSESRPASSSGSPVSVRLPQTTVQSGPSPTTSTSDSNNQSRPNSAEIGKELYTALYNYRPIKEDELELKIGESYCVTEKCKDGWFKGFSIVTQKRGVFPGNYVRLASIHILLKSSRSSSTSQAPIPSPRQYSRPFTNSASPTAIARPRYHRSESAPDFNQRRNTEGSVVNGAQENRQGVQDNGVIRPLLPPPPDSKTAGGFWKKLKTKKKERSRPPPPPPYTWDVPSGHSQVNLPNNRPIPAAPPPPYSSQALPSRQAYTSQAQRARHQRQETVPVWERFRAKIPYPPQSDAELELRVGDIIYVSKKRQDGWYKGTLERNGKTGLFPGCFSEKF